MLGWELNLPERALQLLDKSVANLPDNWRLFYLRGFTHMFFLHNPEKAHQDFVKASQLPNAHAIAARLAARTLVANSSPEEAIEFLAEALKTSTDQNARGALEKRLREAMYERDLRALESAIKIFEARSDARLSTLDQLVQAGIIKGLPRDPFGGTYYLDDASHAVMSTSGRKRPSFFD
jgi:tetratricopeptide (TPR) repeat protein